MRAICRAAMLGLCLFVVSACGQGRAQFPSTTSPLQLERVVLYRNGIGYFERHGEIEGEVLRIKVRKDQVNDLLKSLTIVDRGSGQAVSVSMPLDPDTWANAALATLAPGAGSLAQVLDLLRGVEVDLNTTRGVVSGRIVMVEQIEEEPDPDIPTTRGQGGPAALGRDHKVTVMQAAELLVVRLSKVRAVTLKDGDLAMQFHRRLDAAAGEGMFQQIEVAIRLDNADSHDLVVSYVVEAPMWKPTYRVVLPKDGKGEALLQAWAVVDNTSGEDWRNVRMSLTAGAPIAFRYDMHTPRRVFREDLSHRVHSRRARVAMGETSFADEEPPAHEPEPEEVAEDSDAFDGKDKAQEADRSGGAGWGRGKSSPAKPMARKKGKKRDRMAAMDMPAQPRTAEEQPSLTMEGLRRSTLAQARASQASGLTRFDIAQPVTVPDGSATMVAVINQPVQGEEAFLFDPNGGGGPGYEHNPFRVVRFRNTTPFALEPGPIAIYSGGSFVGEGISQIVGANTSATIPFAVEPGIMVTRETPAIPQELKLIKIVRGTIHAERFHRVKSVWKVKAQTKKDGFKLFIRHPRYGTGYKLFEKPTGLEELPGAYLVPVTIAAGAREGGIELIEQTPSRVNVSIWTADVLKMLERAMIAQNLDAAQRAKLEPIVRLRREVGKIETQLDARRRREGVLNRRIDQHRRNLKRLKDMKGAEAQRMRQERAQQLEAFTKEGDEIAREVLKLEERREQLVIELEDKLETLTISPKA